MEQRNSKLKTENSKLVLVIGYGNDLRGDDGAGPCVAMAIGALELPGVAAVTARQLTPELAEPLAHADLAVFVDAGAGACSVEVRELFPASLGPFRQARSEEAFPALVSSLGHTGDPAGLLALTRALYGAAPQAWLVTLPALSFELGAGLSEVAAQGAEQALAIVRQIVLHSHSAAAV
jgi:hydrogenase maturation protease